MPNSISPLEHGQAEGFVPPSEAARSLNPSRQLAASASQPSASKEILSLAGYSALVLVLGVALSFGAAVFFHQKLSLELVLETTPASALIAVLLVSLFVGRRMQDGILGVFLLFCSGWIALQGRETHGLYVTVGMSVFCLVSGALYYRSWVKPLLKK